MSSGFITRSINNTFLTFVQLRSLQLIAKNHVDVPRHRIKAISSLFTVTQYAVDPPKFFKIRYTSSSCQRTFLQYANIVNLHTMKCEQIRVLYHLVYAMMYVCQKLGAEVSKMGEC
jgi:hypothetical protein